MPGVVYDGTTNIYYATAIADIAAPTVAEVAAAVDLTPGCLSDGVQPGVTNAKVDSSTIGSTHESQLIGTDGNDFKLSMKRLSPVDTYWDLFVAAYRDHGFIIVDEFNDSGTPPSATDPLSVYPVQVGRPAPANSSKNTEKSFMQDFAVTSAPAYSAITAA